MFSKTSLPILLAVALAANAIPAVAQTSSPASAVPGAPAEGTPKASVAYGKLPLSFEPNLGQTAKQVQWLARGPQYTLFLAGHDAVLELNQIVPGKRVAIDPAEMRSKISSSAIRMNLLGAQTALTAAGEDPQQGKSNYFTGNDPSKWQRNVPMYGKVRLKSVYPGIDLVYYGRQGQLEYDFVVAAGADPSTIRWGFDGAKPEIAPNGDLLLPVAGASDQIRLNKPVVYQVKDGVHHPVDGSFVIAKNGEASFKLGAYDSSQELIIDPTLLFLGALGSGANQTVANGMALDTHVPKAGSPPHNQIVLTGLTIDATFPTTTGVIYPSCTMPNGNGMANRCAGQAGSAFVTKLSGDGTKLVFSTYLHGGDGYESGQAVAIDSLDDNIVVLGTTSSEDFPVTKDAYQSICMPIYNGSPTLVQNCDGYFAGGGTEWVIGGPTEFIAKLSPDGATIVYATFFGGTESVTPVALALDSSDNMYFATTEDNALQTSQVYPNNGNGNIQFPLTSGGYQTQGNSENGPAAALSVLSQDGQTLLYSTFMGTLGTSNGDWTIPQAIAVSPTGLVALGGWTLSSSFPTTPGTVRPACVENPGNTISCYSSNTGFVSVFDPTQRGDASLVYSTYIGGPETNGGSQIVLGLAFDSSNDLFVTGYTNEDGLFTTPGAYQRTRSSAARGNQYAFLQELDPTGSKYLMSTYYGGTIGDSQTQGNAIALDSYRGWVYLYGYNNGYGWDLPVVNPVEALNGNNFAFVAAFTGDAKQLLFSTPIGEAPPNPAWGEYNISQNGVALDSNNNIYLVSVGNDGGNLVPTTGTYSTVGAGGWNRTHFAKLSFVQGPVVTHLKVSPLDALPGENVTFTVAVSPNAQTTPVPTGTVALSNGNTTPPTPIGTITLDSHGGGSFSTSKLSRGDYAVTGSYLGDVNYQTGASAVQNLVINQFKPKVIVVPSMLKLGAEEKLTVGVALTVAKGDPVPTGSVTLSSGGYTSAAATLSAGEAKIVVPPGSLKAATDALTVTYTPNAASLKTYQSATGSASVTVSKDLQEVKFSAPKTPVVYGIKPIPLTASATSGLPVLFVVVSGPGKIVGKMLEVTGAGTIEVEAGQPGNGFYHPATSIKHSIVVEKAKLTVKAEDRSMTQGTRLPTLTYEITGFVNGNTQKTTVTGAPKLTTDVTLTSKPGAYPIKVTVGTLASKDYLFATFKDGTLTVKAP
jgi:hypothetical protein